jgi:hypothetical protein
VIAESLFQVIQSNQHRQTYQPIPQAWESVWEKFTAVWIADGSTLEALKRKLKILRNKSQPLAGKMMMLVEVFTHQPMALWYSEDAKANDKTFTDQLLERLPAGGLLVFDLGFFKFPLFATWIFYIVLSDLSAQVAVALNQPLERISVEMVFRGLYHFAQACIRGEADEVVPYLVEHHKRLGLVKARRKRHRENAACSHQIWVLAA